MSQRLGDLLVKEKVITPEQLAQATKVQKETNCRLGSALVKLGFLTDEDVTNFLSRQYGVPAINLSYFEIDPAVVKLIPFETAKRYQILPLSRVGASLTIAMVDPTNVFAMDDIKFMTGFNIEPVVASESSIRRGHRESLRHGKEEDLEQVMQSMTEISDSRRRAAGRRTGNGSGAAGESCRRSSHREAGEPGAYRRSEARSQRHSYGALRKRIPRSLSY